MAKNPCSYFHLKKYPSYEISDYSKVKFYLEYIIYLVSDLYE